MAANKKDCYAAAFQRTDGKVYGGKGRYMVRHPEHKTVRVAAPDEISAIAAAATAWGVPWTSYRVYAFAEARRDWR